MVDGTRQETVPGTDRTTGCRTRFGGLLAPGLPADRLDRLARALQLSATAEPAGPEPLAVLLSGEEPGGDAATKPAIGAAATADALWLPPVAAWIEPPAGTDAATLALALGPLLADAACCDLYLNLTTATAHDLQLGGRLLAALSARHPLEGDRRDDVELALHEAVSNALVHGNLGVIGMQELSAQELDRFSHDLADRLADPVLAARRIVVALRFDPLEGGPAEDGRWLATVEIVDEGAGFTPGPRTNSGASGRGLDLIGSIADGLEIEDGGRRIRLRFAL